MAWLHQPDYRSVELPGFASFESMFEEFVESMGTSVDELELAAIARVTSGYPAGDDACGVVHADLESEAEEADKHSDSGEVNSPTVRLKVGGAGSRSIHCEAAVRVLEAYRNERGWTEAEMAGVIDVEPKIYQKFIKTCRLRYLSFDVAAAVFGLKRHELMRGDKIIHRPDLAPTK